MQFFSDLKEMLHCRVHLHAQVSLSVVHVMLLAGKSPLHPGNHSIDIIGVQRLPVMISISFVASCTAKDLLCRYCHHS